MPSRLLGNNSCETNASEFPMNFVHNQGLFLAMNLTLKSLMFIARSCSSGSSFPLIYFEM